MAIEPGFKDNVKAWDGVFNGLINRGLDSSKVQLGIMDGLPGLESLFKRKFLNAKTQRCWVHSLKNALAKTPARLQLPFKTMAHKMMYAASKEDALRGMQNLKQAIEEISPVSLYGFHFYSQAAGRVCAAMGFCASYWLCRGDL